TARAAARRMARGGRNRADARRRRVSPATTWAAALDALEARLDELDTASGSGARRFSFAAPAVEGAMPDSLVPRAQARAERSDAPRQPLAQEASEPRAPPRRLPRVPPPPRVGRRLDIGA